MILTHFKQKRKIRDAADSLYRAVVEQARHPHFYSKFGVPDTPDGRFDLILLHAYVVLRRLRGIEGSAKKLSQRFFDRIFEDMDHNLREMGVGDLRVGKKVKEMAQLFYGRIAAYDETVMLEDEALEQALARNLYRDEMASPRHLAIMAGYLRREVVDAQGWQLADMLSGQILFGAPPETGGKEEVS